MEVVLSYKFTMYQSWSRGYALKWTHNFCLIEAQENQSHEGPEPDIHMDRLGQNPTKPKTTKD